MKESEIRILFLKISNRYAFAYDDFKVKEWQDDLKDVPFERALENLRRYCLNPTNTFPPHPGIFAENPSQSSEGNYVLNTHETRLMLEEQDRMLLIEASTSIPDTAIERMKKLGYTTTIKQLG